MRDTSIYLSRVLLVLLILSPFSVIAHHHTIADCTIRYYLRDAVVRTSIEQPLTAHWFSLR